MHLKKSFFQIIFDEVRERTSVRIFPAARSAGFQAGKITWESREARRKKTFFISVATSLLSGYLRSSQRTYLVRLIPATKSPALKSRAQLVDISKLGLNSKIKNSAILSFAERAILPLRGRIAFCLQSEPCFKKQGFLI